MDSLNLAHLASAWLEPAIILVIITDMALLASSRLATCVRLAAVQGIVLSALPLAHGPATPHLAAFCLLTLAAKGIGFPWFLQRILRRAQVRLEIEPYISYPLSLILGMAGLALSMGLEKSLGMPPGAPISPHAFAVGFATILAGFLLIITRRKAITQVIGYLVLENGIFLLGTTMAPHGSLLVELCILLDLLVAVFVMGIAIHHISREFHSIDTNLFCTIRD